MCSVSGGVLLLKEVAGVITSPVAALIGEEEESESSDEEDSNTILVAKTTPPLCLECVAPPDAVPGQPVVINGPHGPIAVPLPDDAVPGKTFSIKLGPPEITLKVPHGAAPGSMMSFQNPDGQAVQVRIPEDKKPGDEFSATPPVLMVQVPKGAEPGQQIRFASASGREMAAAVPPGMSAGQYFAVYVDAPVSANQQRNCPSILYLPTAVNEVPVIVHESDDIYRVSNAYLQAQGAGLGYRLSRDFNAASGMFIGWEERVRGKDMGDGWLRCDMAQNPPPPPDVKAKPSQSTMDGPSAEKVAEQPVGKACNKCGAHVKEDQKFCSNCGAKQFIECAGCGITLSPTTKFCHNCGRKNEEAFQETEATETASGESSKDHVSGKDTTETSSKDDDKENAGNTAEVADAAEENKEGGGYPANSS